MNIKKFIVSQILPGLLLMVSAGLVYAQVGGLYDLTWYTIDSGGSTNTSSGPYTLSSTIGQPEAQPAMHSGGRYVLLDGFWPSLQPSAICPGGAAMSYTPTNPDPNQTTTFNGQITNGNGVITFTWNFGDNSDPAFGQSVSHIFTANNIYTVVMTASGDQSCIPPPNVSTTTANITVGFGIPVAKVYLPTILKATIGNVLPTANELARDPGHSPPAPVSGLWGLTATGGTGLIIGWTAAPPEDAVEGYYVYRRARDSNKPFIRLATVPPTTTVYADTAVICGYIYYVTAFNPAGQSPPSAATYYAPACR